MRIGAQQVRVMLSVPLKFRGCLGLQFHIVLYQLVHATALVGMSAYAQSSTSKTKTNNTALAGKLMMVGTVMFSGSIYLLSLEIGPKKLLGPTTPIGGLCMIAGWVVLAL